MAAEIVLRFYEELNDYLPAQKRKREFAYRLDNAMITIRQILQALGVPESEVELVLVNGVSSGFSSFLRPGDRVSIYPVFESFDVTSLLKIRREPLRHTCFVTDLSLSCLASYLRSLGFDILVECPARAAEISEEEHRILLMSDSEFPCSGLSRVYVVRNTEPREQLKEVLSRFDLMEKRGQSPKSPNSR
jgi:hypothetical protein